MNFNNQSTDQPKSSKAIRTMIVDDSKEAMVFLKDFLDYQQQINVVANATDGAECLALAPSVYPELIIMDYRMPVMDGIRATRGLRAASFQGRIIVITLDSDPQIEQAAIAAGADGFCQKAELLEKLMPIIEKLFAGR